LRKNINKEKLSLQMISMNKNKRNELTG